MFKQKEKKDLQNFGNFSRQSEGRNFNEFRDSRNFESNENYSRPRDFNASPKEREQDVRPRNYSRNYGYADQQIQQNLPQAQRPQQQVSPRNYQRKEAPRGYYNYDQSQDAPRGYYNNVQRQDAPRGYYNYDQRQEYSGQAEAIRPNSRVEYARGDMYEDLPVGGAFDSYSPTLAPYRTEAVQKTKRNISNKVIALISVYFVIIAIITSLILVNAFPSNAKNADAETTPIERTLPLSQEAALTVYTAGGAVLTEEQSKVNYTYEKSTNMFDKLCDWIENLVG